MAKPLASLAGGEPTDGTFVCRDAERDVAGRQAAGHHALVEDRSMPSPPAGAGPPFTMLEIEGGAERLLDMVRETCRRGRSMLHGSAPR